MTLPHRATIADWPLDLRERWGRLANALEESGQAKFPESEEQAYRQVCRESEAEQPPGRDDIARWFQTLLPTH